MVEVVDELKAKLAEIDAKTEELRREIVVLDDQKAAFETVIRVYESSFELAAPPSKARRTSSRETASGRVTELLKGRNNPHIVLDPAPLRTPDDDGGDRRAVRERGRTRKRS